MTSDDQQFIVQNFAQHLAANGGNKITEALGQGLLNVLAQIIAVRIEAQDPPKE